VTDRKISELTNITGADLADNDEFVVVDTSADETKAITYGELKNFNGTLTSDGLTVDTNTLHVDATNNRVGIGTTSPSAPIAAVGSLDILQLTGTSGNAFARFTDSDASSDFSIGADDGSGSGAGAFIIYDRNATAYRMAIDSSGNLLVGHTSAFSPISNGGSGVTATAAGQLFAGHAGTPLYVNREDSDGDIAVFRKDGSTVGSIGARGGQLYIGTGDTALKFLPSVDAVVGATAADGQGRDGAIDLGLGGSRFKDLYLSGGVYLGGTGSANKLDDYEEGTFSPAIKGNISNPSTAATANGYYTKVGNLVSIHIKFSALNLSGASGYFYFEALPFSGATSTNDVGSVMHYNAITHNPDIVTYVSGLQVYIYSSVSGGIWYAANHTGDSSAHMNVSFTYRTNA